MAQGVPIEEANQILGHEIEALEARNTSEAAAILFAQHYAEQLDQIDPASIENLRKHYNDAEVAEILAYVRFIDRVPSHGVGTMILGGLGRRVRRSRRTG